MNFREKKTSIVTVYLPCRSGFSVGWNKRVPPVCQHRECVWNWLSAGFSLSYGRRMSETQHVRRSRFFSSVSSAGSAATAFGPSCMRIMHPGSR